MPEPAVYTVTELVTLSHHYALTRGFWPAQRHEDIVKRVPEALALINEEVSEAMRDWRKDPEFPFIHFREDGKPEGFAAELAAVVLRVCDLAGALGLDLDNCIREVRVWSESNRGHRHGDVR